MAPRHASPSDGIAWVTGASTGIGRAVSLELVRRGWTVAATARNLADLRTLEMQAGAGRVLVMPGDVTDRAAMQALVSRIEDEGRCIALGFLNVGTYIHDASETPVGEGFRKTLDVNIGGTLNCLEPLIPHMRVHGGGQIAVVSSVAGYGGLPNAAAYCLSKAGLIAMCESLKFTLDPQNILMQVVCPGFVKTPLTDRNEFPMPFIISVEDAARRICDGLERGGFEIAFPRRMAWSLKLLNLLPYSWYFNLVRRGTAQR